MRNILEIARLFRVLEDETMNKEEKVETIKLFRENGVISDDEALELAIEYFT